MFKVEWEIKAYGELATLWAEADSSDRRILTTWIDNLEDVLARDPDQAGESREEDRRIIIELPFGCIVRVYKEIKRVRVLNLWRIDRHFRAS